MFGMELDNSQILQGIVKIHSMFVLYSLMLRVFNRTGKCCMLHRNRDVMGFGHGVAQRVCPSFFSSLASKPS